MVGVRIIDEVFTRAPPANMRFVITFITHVGNLGYGTFYGKEMW